jgi:hypothetical protein
MKYYKDYYYTKTYARRTMLASVTYDDNSILFNNWQSLQPDSSFRAFTLILTMILHS